MERTLDVRTGEAVAIEYELAGLGSRFLAVVVDLMAQAGILLVLAAVTLTVLPSFVRVAPSKYATALVVAIVAVVLFLVAIGWFIIFETWWSGRTPGKRALGIRVVRDGGFPLDFGAAVIRNLVRLVELMLGFYALSAVCALVSQENKRLGDFAAGTIVVRDRADAPVDLDAYLARPVRSGTGLGDEDRMLIERFLARRATLDGAARVRLATRIAERVRPTLVAQYRNLEDEALLEWLVGG